MKRSKAILSALMALSLFLAIPAMAADYLTVSVAQTNSAPVAENLSLETYRGVTVEGSFRAHDPESDEMTYAITVEPKKGAVTADSEGFTYTPNEGKSGKDTFKYVAIDSKGGISREATVTVEIKKQQTKVTYSDVDSYAAVFLAEKGIFVGECVGGEYVFSPDKTVSRGEFLAMCMAVCGIESAAAVSRTGFSDDAAIPVWAKPYVTGAVFEGIVRGSISDDGAAVFRAEDAVTVYEAAVMLDNALGITSASVDADEAVPAWAASSVSDLESVHVISSGVTEGELTRLEAAKMLTNAATVVASRAKKGILDWAM